MPHRPPLARWLAGTNDVTRGFLAAAGTRGLVNLPGGLAPPEAFPAATAASPWSRNVRQQASAMAGDPSAALGYTPVEGLPDLRDALAARFSGPGLGLRRDNVLVTSGGMQGLDLIGKGLLDPGGAVAVKAATYRGALDAWRLRDPRYRPLRPEAPGFDPASAMSGAEFAYALPNFSNPAGRLVGLAVRRALLAASAAVRRPGMPAPRRDRPRAWRRCRAVR